MASLAAWALNAAEAGFVAVAGMRGARAMGTSADAPGDAPTAEDGADDAGAAFGGGVAAVARRSGSVRSPRPVKTPKTKVRMAAAPPTAIQAPFGRAPNSAARRLRVETSMAGDDETRTGRGGAGRAPVGAMEGPRSEEHTSELQSQSNLV